MTTSSLGISYITVEAIPKNKVETGIMSMKCEEHVVFGLLAGLKTYLKEDDATPFLLIKTNDSKGVSVLNMKHTNILSITSYDGLTKTLCVFRDSEVDQKIAFDMIIEAISELTENNRVLVDGETIDVETYTDLPEEFTAEKKAGLGDTQAKPAKVIKRAPVVAGPNNTVGYSKPQQNVGTTNSYYNNAWQKKPTFFKRNTEQPKKGALANMKKKVLALAAGDFEVPEFPALPKPKEPSFGHGTCQRHYGYCD